MTTENGLTITTTRALSTPLEFTDEQRRMIRDSFANGASDGEFAVLMEIAKARRLNPLLRQIHFVKRWDGEKKREVWSSQVSIDGLRAIAERTGLYDGQDEPEFVESERGALVACKVRVYRKDWPRPAVGVAYYEEFVQKTREGKPNRMWSQMPRVMLAKVAESIALRKAFPEDTGGLYTPEEMGQAENDPVIVDAAPAITRESLAALDASRQIAAAPRAVRELLPDRIRDHAEAIAGHNPSGGDGVRPLAAEAHAGVDDAAGASWSSDLAACSTLTDVRAAWDMWRPTFSDGSREASNAKSDVLEWAARHGVYLDAAGTTAVLSTLPADALRVLDLSASSDMIPATVRAQAVVSAARHAKDRGGAWDKHSKSVVWSTLLRGYARHTGAKSMKAAEAAIIEAISADDTPPDGTDGPSGPRSAANDTAGAEGSPAPAAGTHGPVALAAPDAWRLSAAGITAHVAEIGNIPRLANSARRNLGAIMEPLRTHAVHVYAGRLQRLSVDGDGSTLAWEACVDRTETWLREGPKDAAPQRRKDKAA